MEDSDKEEEKMQDTGEERNKELRIQQVNNTLHPIYIYIYIYIGDLERRDVHIPERGPYLREPPP